MNLDSAPTWRANCQMVRSGQSMRVLIPMVYLFSGEESKAKNSKVAHEYVKHREHDEFILVRASGEYYLTSSCWCRLLEDWMDVQGVASSALYWPADEVGSQTPGQLRPGDLIYVTHLAISHRSALVLIHRGLVLYAMF
jgi:hypothetical protein